MGENLATGLKLFNNARAYSQAAKLLCAKTTGTANPYNTHLGQSAAVYAGLAVEHYLKTLHFLEHKREYNEHGKRPHDFTALYTALRHKTRKDMEYRYVALTAKRVMTGIPAHEARNGEQIPRDLKETLRLWTEAFIHLRLPAPNTIDTRMLFFHDIEEVLKNVIITLRPEWTYRSGRSV